MPGCDILADNKEENPLLTWEFGFLLRKNKGGKSSPHIGVRIFASQKLGGLKMHKELEVMKPRCKGLWKKCSALIAGMYFRVLSITPLIAKAADKKSDTTDTGVSDVTDGIDVIKDLVLGCVGGVGGIFLAWGLLDFGTAYAAHETTQQSQAIKKVIGGLIMIAVPAILKLLGVS